MTSDGPWASSASKPTENELFPATTTSPLSTASVQRANISRHRAIPLVKDGVLLRSPPRSGHSSQMSRIFRTAGRSVQPSSADPSLLSPSLQSPQRFSSRRRLTNARQCSDGGVRLPEQPELDGVHREVSSTRMTSPYGVLQATPVLNAKDVSDLSSKYPRFPAETLSAGIDCAAQRPPLATLHQPYRSLHHPPPDQSLATPTKKPHKRGGANASGQVRLRGSSSIGSWSGDSEFFRPEEATTSLQHTPADAEINERLSGSGELASNIPHREQDGDYNAAPVEWWQIWLSRNEHIVKWLDEISDAPIALLEDEACPSPESELKNLQSSQVADESLASDYNDNEVAANIATDRPFAAAAQQTTSHRMSSLDSSYISMFPSTTASSEHIERKYCEDLTLTGPELTKLLTPKQQTRHGNGAAHDSEAEERVRQLFTDRSTGFVQSARLHALPAGQETIAKLRAQIRAQLKSISRVPPPHELAVRDEPHNLEPVTGCSAPQSLTPRAMDTRTEQQGGTEEGPLTPLSPDVEVYRGYNRHHKGRRDGKKRSTSYYDRDIIGPLTSSRHLTRKESVSLDL